MGHAMREYYPNFSSLLHLIYSKIVILTKMFTKHMKLDGILSFADHQASSPLFLIKRFTKIVKIAIFQPLLKIWLLKSCGE